MVDEPEIRYTRTPDGVNIAYWVIGEGSRQPVLIDADKMPGARFYPRVRINFAENLLRRRDRADAIVFWGEDRVKRRVSFAELYDLVSRSAQ